jgi:integrase
MFKIKKSPFWYFKAKDETGKWTQIGTKLRWDDPNETAEARLILAQMDIQELKPAEIAEKDRWNFVSSWLANNTPSDYTRKRYTGRWKWVSLYLAEKKLHSPAAITFGHGQDYINWRTSHKKRTGKTVCKNTALYELKTFSQIMQHAAHLGLCSENPLVKLGIRKDDPAEKSEITDEEFQILLPALDKVSTDPQSFFTQKRKDKTQKNWPDKEWIRTAFLISMHTGCRLKDTRIAISNLDFNRWAITFAKPKGGRKRAFSIPMPEPLRPMLLQFKKEGRRWTLEFPHQPSRQFGLFLDELGLGHLCFHCLRVTFITRLARAGVQLSIAMRLVNHASETIHKIYQKLQVEDVRIPNLFGPAQSPGRPAETPQPGFCVVGQTWQGWQGIQNQSIPQTNGETQGR